MRIPFAIFNLVSLLSMTVLSSSCGIFNAGTVSSKYNEVRATFDGRSYRNRKSLSSVSLSIRGIQHPYKFKNWSGNFRLSPSLHFDRTVLESTETVTLPNGSEYIPPRIKIKRLSTLGNIKYNWHTPIGQFVATAGYGLALFKADDDLGLDTFRTREIAKLDFIYIGFLSRRVFILTGPRFFYDQLSHFSIAFRLGYFWGDPGPEPPKTRPL